MVIDKPVRTVRVMCNADGQIHVFDVTNNQDIKDVQAFSWGYSIDDSIIEARLIWIDLSKPLEDDLFEVDEIVYVESINFQAAIKA